MRYSILSAAFLLVCFGKIHGQTAFSLDSMPDKALTDVVISSQYLPMEARASVSTVKVIDQKTIESRAVVNLGELLQNEGRLRLEQDGALGTALNINGISGQNVKVLIDGVPVIGRLNGNIDLSQIQLAGVQQVEIIEGAQSLMYGSEASAGVVNIITKKSQVNSLQADINGQYETNGHQTLQGRVGLRLGKFFLQTTANQLNFEPAFPDGNQRGKFWNPKSQLSGNSMLRFSPSERLDLRLTATRFTEKVGNLGAINRPQFKPYAFDDRYLTNRTDLNLHAEGRTKERLFWQGTVAYNQWNREKESVRLDLTTQEKLFIDGQQDTAAATGFLTRFTLATDKNARTWNFLGGLENYAETARGARIIDTSASNPGAVWGNDLGIFATAKANFTDYNLTLQGGARYTQNRLFGGALSPSVWVKWQPKETVSLRLSWANGFRSPNLKELYFNFFDINHALAGNTNLRPERSDNLRADFSLQKKHNSNLKTTWNLQAFYNDLRQRIVFVEYEPAKYRYDNLDRWKSAGGSLSSTLNWNDRLTFRTEAIVTGFPTTLSGGSETGMQGFFWSSDWVNDVNVRLYKEHLSLNVWHKFTGRAPFFSEDNGILVQSTAQSWHLLNAGLQSSFFKQALRLNVGVKNIADVRQVNTGAAPTLHGGQSDIRTVHWGRTFFVSVNARLGKG